MRAGGERARVPQGEGVVRLHLFGLVPQNRQVGNTAAIWVRLLQDTLPVQEHGEDAQRVLAVAGGHVG